MQTHCIRCKKKIDTVQGYKFSPNEYLCMPCYDQYKAERTAKAKKQHKNPLLEQFGTDVATSQPTGTRIPAPPSSPKPSVAPPEPKSAEPLQPSPTKETSAQTPPSPEPDRSAPPPQTTAAADTCDVCKKPITDFKVPLKDGKKVCWDCNEILRDVAKSMILNVQCPHCGKDIQVSKS